MGWFPARFEQMGQFLTALARSEQREGVPVLEHRAAVGNEHRRAASHRHERGAIRPGDVTDGPAGNRRGVTNRDLEERGVLLRPEPHPLSVQVPARRHPEGMVIGPHHGFAAEHS